MSKKLRVAIVGFGYMGEIRRRIVEADERLELIGISEAVSAKREKIQDCKVFDDFDQLLSQNPDIVFVCTPNAYSPQICQKSMDEGIHVFCEKPPGRNLQDIENIIAAEKNNSRIKLMFGFNHRFHPGIIKAKIIVNSGRLGKILGLRGVYGKSGGVNFRSSWRNKKDVSGGGILLDQGIHMLDLFLYFCGDFSKIKCFTDNTYWDMEVEDNAYLTLQNEKNQTAFLHSSATLWKHTFSITIIMEEGYIIVDGLLSKTGSYGRERLVLGRRQFEDETDAVGNPSEEVTYFDRDLSWKLEVDEFVKSILEDKPVLISNSSDAYKVMNIIDKAYRDAAVEQKSPSYK